MLTKAQIDAIDRLIAECAEHSRKARERQARQLVLSQYAGNEPTANYLSYSDDWNNECASRELFILVDAAVWC